MVWEAEAAKQASGRAVIEQPWKAKLLPRTAAPYICYFEFATVPLQGGYHLLAAESGTTCHASVWRARGFHTAL